ncbi:hypothetical protein [Peribacillus sp. SCS-155]|uniref:hypothetical protein n=1 Tax=Peribacillus sedimenti TaxID=3115297 RepID=UPI0039064635
MLAGEYNVYGVDPAGNVSLSSTDIITLEDAVLATAAENSVVRAVINEDHEIIVANGKTAGQIKASLSVDDGKGSLKIYSDAANAPGVTEVTNDTTIRASPMEVSAIAEDGSPTTYNLVIQ